MMKILTNVPKTCALTVQEYALTQGVVSYVIVVNICMGNNV